MDYSHFISAFHLSMREQTYLKQDQAGYQISRSKPAHFKTKSIIQAAETCLSRLASDTCNEPLTNRIQLVEKLQEGLTRCAGRIENSIKRRWWYRILHFFGYRAKPPAHLQDLLTRLPLVTRSLRLKEQQASQNQVPATPLAEQKVEIIDPFNFEDLPQDIQHVVYSTLPLSTVTQLGQASRVRHQLASQYLTHPHGQLRLLNELVATPLSNKCPRQLSKYCSTLDALLAHPELKNCIMGDKGFRTAFFDHLISSPWLSISVHLYQSGETWCDKNKKELSALIDFFFAYASDEQLIAFIKNICERRGEQVGFSSVIRDGLTYSPICKLLMTTLTPGKIEHLLKFPGMEYILFSPLMRIYEPKQHFHVFKCLYQKLPTSSKWQALRISSLHSSLSSFKASLAAVEISEWLNKPLENSGSDRDKEIEQRAHQINQFLGSIPSFEGLLFDLTDLLITNDELKKDQLLILNYLLASKRSFCFVTQLLHAYEGRFFGLIIKEYMKIVLLKSDGQYPLADAINSICNITSRISDLFYNNSNATILEKERACQRVLDFIQAARDYPEPMQTALLSSFPDTWDNAINRELKEAFSKAGLNSAHYPPRFFLCNAFYKHYPLLSRLSALNSVEEVAEALANLSQRNRVQALVGGVRLPNGTVLKPTNQQLVLQVLVNKGLDPKSFTNSLELDFFLSEDPIKDYSHTHVNHYARQEEERNRAIQGWWWQQQLIYQRRF